MRSIIVIAFVSLELSSTLPAAEPGPIRKAWTNGKITGSPEAPPPYQSADAFPNAKFDHPVLTAA